MENSKAKTEHENKIKIFFAKPEDVRGIQEVFYRAWLKTYPNEELGITADDIEERFRESSTDEALSERAKSIENLPEDESLFVAKEGEKIIGACRIVRAKERNRLQALYVLPEYQNRGIGMMLWEEAKKAFGKDKGKDIIVAVAIFNKKAIDFYKKLGFEDTGRRFTDERLRMKSGAIIPEMEMVIKEETK